MAYKVPFVDPKTHYAKMKSEIDEAIIGCLTQGDLVNRQQLRDFEDHLADFVGTKYAVGLNSGYHALEFACRAAGIGPGDEVVTVGHTFVASVSAIINCGAIPVLIDVSEDFNINPDLIEPAITSRTKAILPVHLNGRISDMDPILRIAEKRNLVVIEDAAQAIGASYKGKNAGNLGFAGCFSFYPFKALGGIGDGGALTTDDPAVAQMAVRYRYNGEDRETGEYHYHGVTALLDNVNAAVLDAKLHHLPDWVKHRRMIAMLYQEGLRGISDLKLPHFNEDNQIDSFQNYVIRTTVRDPLRAHLTANGVETLVHWPKPMWEHEKLKLEKPSLPETIKICQESISLPLSAETTPEHVEATVGFIQNFFEKG